MFLSLRSWSSKKGAFMAVFPIFGAGYTAVTGNQYLIASFIMIGCGCWLGSCYFYSPMRESRLFSLAQLAKKAAKSTTRSEVKEKYTCKYRLAVLADLSAILCIIILTNASIYWVNSNKQEYELSLLEGRLYPANDPTPPNVCDDRPETRAGLNDVVVLFGSDAAVIGKFPYSLISVRDKNVFVVDRNEDGSIVLSLDVLDADGKVIVTIDHGRFQINPNNYLPKKFRPDRYTLVITDQYKTQVLKFRYLNKNAISVDAVLRFPGLAQPIKLSSSSSEVSNYHHNCIAHSMAPLLRFL